MGMHPTKCQLPSENYNRVIRNVSGLHQLPSGLKMSCQRIVESLGDMECTLLTLVPSSNGIYTIKDSSLTDKERELLPLSIKSPDEVVTILTSVH